MAKQRHLSVTAMLVALAMALIACSGSRIDDGSAADGDVTEQTSPEDLVTDQEDDEEGTPAVDATTAPAATRTGTVTPRQTSSPSISVDAKPATGFKPANLYSGADDRIGITDDRITLCGHAALIFAEAFDTRPEDINMYWEVVNEAGGIYGRQVVASWEDDAYAPDQAVQAAEACKAKNPFFLLGGIGFDQIPAVRTWAEQNKMLYLHHIAVEAGLEKAKYSFSLQPSVDETGRAFGEYIVDKYRTKRVGIVYRQSENWEPGHRAGKAVMERHNVNVVRDLPVERNQGAYAAQIQALRTAPGGEAEVVWIWENALAAGALIAQAANQGYRPKWIVFPFQTTLDLLGNNALNPTIEGVATWPAYKWGGYDGNPFKQHEYNAEIKRFEAAYAAARRGTNDILWQVWIGFKALHDLLLRCGPDCTRNKVAGLMLSGLQATVKPNCAANFAHGRSLNGRIGGHHFIVQETMPYSSGTPGRNSVWKTTRWCTERLL